ncbi:MAG: DUF3226 domain-containing protein [Phycisphaerae bacterium]
MLLVEGKDEVGFFEALLGKLPHSEVQVIDVGGKDKFDGRFEALVKLPGFANVERIGIVRDAEESYAGAIQSVQGTLARHRLPVPASGGEVIANGSMRVGCWVMPNNSDPASIETICWGIIDSKDQRRRCTRIFTWLLRLRIPSSAQASQDTGLPATGPYLPANLDKVRMQAYMGSLHKPMRELGTAARAGVWNLEHRHLSTIRNFLAELFS